MGNETQQLIRAISTRAPYRRGGLAFAPTEREHIVPRAELTDEQLRLLADDPAISLSSSSDLGETWGACEVPPEPVSAPAKKAKGT